MPLHGDLRQTSLVRLIDLLAAGRRSGLLSVRAGRDTAEVFIRRGYLQEARRSRSSDEAAHHLFPEQLDQASRESLQRLARGDELGTVLLLEYLGVSAREQSLAILREQAINLLKHVAGWRKAEFSFDASAERKHGRASISLPLSVVKRHLRALGRETG